MHQEAAAFAAGKLQAQLEFVITELKDVKSELGAVRNTTDTMGKQLATQEAMLQPLTKLFWAVITAAVGAVGASVYAVIISGKH